MDTLASRRHAIGEDFRNTVEGTLPAEKVDEFVASIHAATDASSHCLGRIQFYFFYARVGLVTLRPGDPFPYVFDGEAGGLFFVGNLAVDGQLYTSDLGRLVRATRRFWLSAGPIGTFIFFMDENDSYLGDLWSEGTLLQGAVGTGSGRWVHP